MAETCFECGGPLGPQKPVTRDVLDERVRVTVLESTCRKCGESEQAWRCIGRFFDLAEELLGESPNGDTYTAKFDDAVGDWVFERL
jgi:hypothetical protein